MARRKKSTDVDQPEVPKPNADWIVTNEYQVNGRWLKPHTEFTVHGVKGRMVFVSHTQTPTSEWIDAFSPNKQYRAFRPDRIKTVHTKQKVRP